MSVIWFILLGVIGIGIIWHTWRLVNLKCPKCKRELYNPSGHFDNFPNIYFTGLCTKCKRKIKLDDRGREIL